jgi:hypothetical protein
MTTNSTWAALRNPAFRKLWIAAVISGTRVSGRLDPKFSVCSVHFSDSGIDAGGGLESVTPQFFESGSVVHQHGHYDFAGAMALGGVIWGSAGAIAGTSYTLLGAAVLFLTSLMLARRFSINFAGNLEETVLGDLSIRIEPKDVAPIALTRELLAA